MLRKKSSPKIDEALAASVNYEISLADMARRSERRAWFVSFSAITMSLILAGGYFLVLPLKERVPFLVMADAYTGQATVARLSGDFGKNGITANEAVNKSNIAHYIVARESYDIAQRNIRDWNTIYTMSSPDVAKAYTSASYDRRNPGSLINVYGPTRAIRVEIVSITLLDRTQDAEGPGTGGGDATVRFQRLLVEKSTGVARILDTRVANLRYNYQKNLALDEKQRFDNPLGFQVTSYRVDTELVSIPVQPPAASLDAPLPASGGQPGAVGQTPNDPTQGEGAAPVLPQPDTAPANPTGATTP